MRQLMERGPALAVRLLGIRPAIAPVALSARFPITEMEADLLLRVGPRHLVHVEYQRWPETDMVLRMLGYRWAITTAHPKDRLEQFVIMLGDGTVDLGPPDAGFTLDLTVVHLRDHDPADFLTDPALATMAVLGAGTDEHRATVFAEAVRLIQKEGGDHTDELMGWAVTFATIRLEGSIITNITEEAGMSAEGLREVFEGIKAFDLAMDESRQEGRQEGRVEALREALEDRFGADPVIDLIAHRLARWPRGAMHAALTSDTLDELTSKESPA